MFGGPFHNLDSFTTPLNFLIESPIFFRFRIFSSDSSHLSNQGSNKKDLDENGKREEGTAFSILVLMNIIPAHRSIEIGTVLFSSLQRAIVANASLSTYS